MSEHAVSERGVLMLAPGRPARHYRRDLWAYRELFAILAWPPSRITHRLSTVSFSPNSVATLPIGKPLLITRSTASRLKTSGNTRRVVLTRHLPPGSKA
jgi:hypothetical protein